MSQRASQGPSPARRKKTAKPHVPFTDDSDVGKRTGLRISRGPQDDDGMEDFEHIIDRVYENDKDNRRRPRQSAAKTSPIRSTSEDPEEPAYPNEASEMSFESPVAPSAPPKTSTSSTLHAGPSRRSVPREVVEYRDMPSPNRSLPSRSKSQPPRHRLVSDHPRGRRISEEPSVDPSFGPPDSPAPHTNAGDQIGSSPGRASPDLVADDLDAPSPAVHDDDDEHIAEGTHEGHGIDDEDEGDGAEEEEVVPTRKRRNPSPSPAKRKRAKTKPVSSRQVAFSDGNDSDPDDDAAQGARRGRRRRFAPLEYWRLEKVIYKKEQGIPIPVIESIIRVPKEQAKPLGARQKRKRAPSSSKGHEDSPDDPPQSGPPEAGWDDNTNPMGVVLQFPSTDKEVERRLAFTAKMVAPREAQNASFKFQKIFGDGEFIASGVICIPPKGEKPPKPSKDNTYIFYCIEGVVQVKVHRTSFVIAPGGMFLVPRGNQYWIENPGSREAKLFFAQGRQVPLDEMESVRGSEPPRASSSAPRSSNRPL